jgi:ABC-2 type transport system ATP-binding protein
VAIIDRGRIIAQGSPEDLVQAGGERHLEIRLTDVPDGLPEAVTSRDHFVEGDRVVIRAPHPRRIVAEVLNGLYARDLKITEVRIKESSLEEVFVQLTGRTIDEIGEVEEAVGCIAGIKGSASDAHPPGGRAFPPCGDRRCSPRSCRPCSTS